MKEISTIICKIDDIATGQFVETPKGECTTGTGLIYDAMVGYRCLGNDGSLRHCCRILSDGNMTASFNVKDAFKVSIMMNDLNQLRQSTVKKAQENKAFTFIVPTLPEIKPKKQRKR